MAPSVKRARLDKKPPAKQEKAVVAAETKQGRRSSTRVARQFVPFSAPDTSKEKSKKDKKAVKKVVSQKQRGKGAKAKGKQSSATPASSPSKAGKSAKRETKRDRLNKIAAGRVSKAGAGAKAQKAKQTVEKKAKGRKVGNARLVERTDVAAVAANPFVFGTAAPDFVGRSVHHRRLIRAAARGDAKELKAVLTSGDLSSSAVLNAYSHGDKTTALELVVLNKDAGLLGKYLSAKKAAASKMDKVQPEANLLKRISSGRSNFYMLGRATRTVEMSRGGKEGNNAFLNYEAEMVQVTHVCRRLIAQDVPFVRLQKLSDEGENYFSSHLLSQQVVEACRMGRRELAGQLIEGHSKYNFNQLHMDSLNASAKPPARILPVSVIKKGTMNRSILPLHTAALHPTPAFLQAMRAVETNINQPDADNWFTIHYAAVADSPACLKYLLDNDVSIVCTTKQGETPLHCAARAGRGDNIKLILAAMDKVEAGPDGANEEEEEEGGKKKKPSKSMVNAKNKRGETALHLAVQANRLSAVESLLSHAKIEVDAPIDAKLKKLTPLMYAVERGRLEIANTLIDKGNGLVEAKDKLKRTAVHHACISGQEHMLAMLLRRGADCVTGDSSGNTPAHYASAYGWLNCLKMLAKVNPECLTAENSWKLTPLSVAYLKGHFGVVTWLLDGQFKASANINCVDADGVTLISSLLRYHDADSSSHLPEQIAYLIDRGVDCSLRDSSGNNPLHVLAGIPVTLNDSDRQDGNSMSISAYLSVVDKIMAAGAAVAPTNVDGLTPFHIALSAGNLALASYLWKKTGDEEMEAYYKCELDENTPTLLHTLLEIPVKEWNKHREDGEKLLSACFDIVPLVTELLTRDADTAAQWMKHRASSAGTPLLQAVRAFAPLNAVGETDEQKKEEKKMLLVSMCNAIRTMASRFPAAITDLAEKEQEEKEKDGEEQDDTAGVSGGVRLVALPSPYGKSPRAFIASRPARASKPAQPSAEETQTLNNTGKVGSVLHACIEATGADTVVLRILLEEVEKSNTVETALSVRDGLQYTPLLLAVARSRNRAAVCVMAVARQAGCAETIHAATVPQIADRADSLKSVLHLAVEKSLLDVVREFKLTPHDWAAVDGDGNSAWHLAARHLTPQAIELFEQLNAHQVPIQANKAGEMPLHVAVNADVTGSADAYLEPIEWLLRHGDANAVDGKGRTPLFYAFVKGKQTLDECCSSSPRDPIAVQSLLLDAMHKQQLSRADRDGNTVLHFVAACDANICAVTLIRHKAAVDAANALGNSPLAVAVLAKRNAVALTLIQAGADVNRKVHCVVGVSENEKPSRWRYLGQPIKQETNTQVSIPSVVVRNTWHSLVYVILDLLDKTPTTLESLVYAAMDNGQHNFGLYLIGLFKRSVSRSGSWQPMDGMVETFVRKLGAWSPSACSCLSELLSLGYPWCDERGRSPPVEAAVEGKKWEVLKYFKEHDESSLFSRLAPSAKGTSPLGALVMGWSGDGTSEEKQWLHEFAGMKTMSVDAEISVPRQALPGATEKAYPEEKELLTPLSLAARSGRTQLVLELLQLGADVNKGPRTALMWAVLSNCEACVKALVDCQKMETAKPAAQNKKNGKASHPVLLGVKRRRMHTGDSDEDEEDSDEDDEEEEEEEQEEEAPVVSSAPALRLLGLNKKLDWERVDENGCNLTHYLVSPCGWQNTHLLDELKKAGKEKLRALLSRKCQSGERSVDVAARLRQNIIMEAMEKILSGPKASRPALPAPVPEDAALQAEVDTLAKEYTRKQIEKEPPVDPSVSIRPCERSGYATNGEIVHCDETNQLFKILLNRTDLAYGTFGFHNFYRMELIKRRESDLWILFTNWGRIGDGKGEHQTTPFGSLADAVKEWKSVWKSKTGQDWLPLADFEDKPKKYRLVKTDSSHRTLSDIPLSLQLDKKRNDPAYRVLRDVSDVPALKKYAALVSLSNCRLRCSFGRIRSDALDEAEAIVERCAGLVRSKEGLKVDPSNTDQLLKMLNEERTLTSRFFELIPLGDYEFGALPVLNNIRNIMQAGELLSRLREVEMGTRLLAAAAEQNGDAIDFLSRVVQCGLSELDPANETAQRIIQACMTGDSMSSIHIKSILRLSPAVCETRFEKHAHEKNQVLLWHGTKAENVLSILRSGLRAVPANSLQCGQAFGTGVYLADRFAKSLGYCGVSAGGFKYMLLCQVALGKTKKHEMHTENKLDGVDTVLVEGSQMLDEKKGITVEGATLNVGASLSRPPSQSYYWRPDYNEYVVTDEARILPRFLVVFK